MLMLDWAVLIRRPAVRLRRNGMQTFYSAVFITVAGTVHTI